MAIKLSRILTSHWWAALRYIKYYEKLAIDEKAILLESEHGKKVNGNIFYVLRYMAGSDMYSDYKLYLSCLSENKKQIWKFLSNHGISGVELVVVESAKYFRLLASAKYLINDTSFLPTYIKKDGQVYLNTWHGTPLKTLGRQVNTERHSLGNIQKNFVCSDYLLYPNEFTKEHMLEDYMLNNIAGGTTLLGGYPRNEAFFDNEAADCVRRENGLEGKKIYAYLPTFRGSPYNTADLIGRQSQIYLNYHLLAIDQKLGDDEVFYVNLHPLDSKEIDFEMFKHIKTFPPNYETYEFLNAADVLVTDYSSVFFDFACTGRKIVFFPYDRDEYLKDRGLYMSMDDLPFPLVYNAEDLVSELRSPKKYDDREFMNQFSPYENSSASQKLCDYVILGEDTGLKAEKIPDNHKENVMIFVGNMAANGITTAIKNLLSTVDVSKRNYYMYFIQKQVGPHRASLESLPEGIYYYVASGIVNLTLVEHIIYNLFNKKCISASLYMKLMGKRIQEDFDKTFKGARIDRMIHFTGYDCNVIVKVGTFKGPKYIYVHNDMKSEIAVRKNSQESLLNYAYNTYDKVIAVSKDILEPTYELAGKKEDITVIENVIDYRTVLQKSQLPIQLDENTQLSVDESRLMEVLSSDNPKFINIGRFAPEKGHKRLVDAFERLLVERPDAYLIIMGGNSFKNGYQELLDYINAKDLNERVILILKVSNPYPILKACDYFVLSSFYEGFGLVLVEADILGKPVISTDIVGPRRFMQHNGGTLVENSEDGLFDGMKMLLDGKVNHMNVDYEAYNRMVIDKFEKLLSE